MLSDITMIHLLIKYWMVIFYPNLSGTYTYFTMCPIMALSVDHIGV